MADDRLKVSVPIPNPGSVMLLITEGPRYCFYEVPMMLIEGEDGLLVLRKSIDLMNRKMEELRGVPAQENIKPEDS